MSQAVSQPNAVVLHIRSGPSDKRPVSRPAEDVDAILASASLRVEVRGDVYRGLARLCTGTGDPLRAVIVCVDGLDPIEFEFFSIVARARRELPVYVYGDDRYESRRTQAIELGATGWLTEDVLLSIAARTRETAAVPADTEVVSPSASPSASASPSPAPEAAGDEPASVPSDLSFSRSEESEESLGDVDDPDDSARVPWRRYADGPARTGPQGSSSSSQGVSPVGPAREDVPASEPLLTDEELQALLGDDVAAMEPEERRPDSTDDSEACGEAS